MWWEPQTLDNFNSLRPGTLRCRYVNLTCYLIPTRWIFKLLPNLTLEKNSKWCLQFPNLPRQTINPSDILIKFNFSAVKTNYSKTLLLWFQLIEIVLDDCLDFLSLPERSLMWEIETIETLPANLHTRLSSHIIIMSRTLFTLPFNGGGKLWWLFFLLAIPRDLCGKFWCFPVWWEDYSSI